MISFEVDGIPQAKGRPRFAKRGTFVTTYTPKQTQEAEEDFKLQSLKHKPDKPLEGPVILVVRFAKIKPKSKSKKVIHWTTKPDLDNLVKLVKDSMNGIFWRDDSQVVQLLASKQYADRNYTKVTLQEI